MAAIIVLAGCNVFASTDPAVTLAISSEPGEGLGFVPAELSTPAGKSVRAVFTNVSRLEHNLVFLIEPANPRSAEIVPPGGIAAIDFMTPRAGLYSFQCTVHEEMRGTLVVQ